MKEFQRQYFDKNGNQIKMGDMVTVTCAGYVYHDNFYEFMKEYIGGTYKVVEELEENNYPKFNHLIGLYTGDCIHYFNPKTLEVMVPRYQKAGPDMKKIKVSESLGPALDWLVARCIGGSIRNENGVFLNQGDGYEYFTPTTDWEQGGPIIDREHICIKHGKHIGTNAYIYKGADYAAIAHGPTTLVAAMRCYVYSKLGDTAEVPEEL